MKLRDYQKDIIDKTISTQSSTLIQVPTGGGKTVIAKEIILNLITKFNQQVLFVAPKIILMEQTAEVFKGLRPHTVHGNQQYDKNHRVLVSTIQTAARRDINPDVIIIDEIHYGYDGKMIENLIKDKPKTRIIGLSATPYDKDGKQLKGFKLVLDKYDTKYMIENNYLVPIESHQLVKVNYLDELKMTAGDYNLHQLSKIVCNNNTILEIVGSTKEYIQKHKKTIVFAVDIAHAELLTIAYQKEGFIVKVLHSKMNKEDVRREIRLFKEGQTKILVSVLMLTTGFDVPDVDVVVIARPTKSQNLYKQMVGRVLRLAKDKTYATLLDCGNVIDNLGLPLEPIKEIHNTNEYSKQKCQQCNSDRLKLQVINNESFWICQDCGNKKNIVHGTYECKLCSRLYTHKAKFIVKNSKLYLDCKYCVYPTLISEYTGYEKLIKIKPMAPSLNLLQKAFINRIAHHLKSKEIILTNTQNYSEYLSSLEFKKRIDKVNKKIMNSYNFNNSLDTKILFENFCHMFDKLSSLDKLTIISEPLKNLFQSDKIKNADEVKIDTEQFIHDIKAGKNIRDKDVSEYLSFKEAKIYIRGLKLKSRKMWDEYRYNKFEKRKRPLNIPLKPNIVYRDDGWIDFNDWLGITQKSKGIDISDKDINNQSPAKCLPFIEARKFARSLNLMPDNHMWKKYVKQKKLPANIPEEPHIRYKNDGWISYEDWMSSEVFSSLV